MLNWFASLYDMYAIIMYLCNNLVSYDNTQLVIKVHLVLDCVYRFTCYHVCLAFTHLITVRYQCLINQFPYLLHLIRKKPVFRDLEGCYGPYRTFPISNLTLEHIFDFSQTIFSKQGITLRVFFNILFSL